jgi:hypothetical protein
MPVTYPQATSLNEGKEQILAYLDKGAVYISNHARIRMFERNITTYEILAVIRNGEIIEEYPDDDPCPSILVFGLSRTTPVHVVQGVCKDHLRIITVYIPDESLWIQYKKRRFPL